MKIGDSVRLIHGTEQGKITKIIDNRQVEIEIEDGFRIPVLKSEIVIVASEETVLNEVEAEDTYFENAAIWNGAYLAFTNFNDKIFKVTLINDTNHKTYFVIGEEKEGQYNGIFSGSVEKFAAVKLHELNSQSFDKWPTLVIQLLFSGPENSEYRPPLVKKINFRTSTFFKNKKTAPIIKEEAVLYRLDLDATKIEAKAIEEQLSNSKTTPKVEFSKPSKEIDLHIEKLVDSKEGMSNTEILNYQLNAFETNLENAQASNMDEIVFIHGIGNGVLKNEIHKKLSQNKTIKFFKEAQKEKFGYGATLVRLH